MVKKFTIPFASQGDANDIPDALQVDGKVSFTQGFGYDYERPYDDPQAKDIAREDMNGLFKAITSAVGELQSLGASEWSNAISYPKGAIVYYEKDLYISQVDDNQNKPPKSWVSITSIANDSLKKAANLSDLTNKATARNNLGLGSSATLNKTDTLGTSTNLVATQKLVNDTKVNLENSINAIENTSKTFLVKSSNLSDLTNKTTARSNLGLGSSATLNKTDVLGTSTNLVATQKLVNDTKINLENSKQDKLEFVGEGKVIREGGWGIGGFSVLSTEPSFIGKNGFYYTRSQWVDSPISGINSGNQGGILHLSNFANKNYALQLFSSLEADDLLFRTKKINLWGPWIKIASQPFVIQSSAAIGAEQFTTWVDGGISPGQSAIDAMNELPDDVIVTRTQRDGNNQRVGYRRIIRTGR